MKLLYLAILITVPLSLKCSEATSETKILPEKLATFKAIQDIHEIASQVAEEVKKNYKTSLQLSFSDFRNICPDILNAYKKTDEIYDDVYNGQTQKGLLLVNAGMPQNYLITPWGRINIYCAGGGSPFGLTMASRLLLDKITAKYLGNFQREGIYYKPHVKFYCRERVLDVDKQVVTLQELSEADCLAARGTKKIIESSQALPVYEICAVNGAAMPNPEVIVLDRKKRLMQDILADCESLRNTAAAEWHLLSSKKADSLHDEPAKQD